MFYNRDFLRAIDGTGEILFKQRLELRQAVIAGDEACAEAAALDHIDVVERSVRQGIEQQRRETMATKRRLMS